MLESHLRNLMNIDQLKAKGYTEIQFFPRCCFVRISNRLLARIEFDSEANREHYTCISIKIINRMHGLVDTLRLNISDVIGVKPTSSNKYLKPHIYVYTDAHKAQWYDYTPTSAEMYLLCDIIIQYMNQFRYNDILN